MYENGSFIFHRRHGVGQIQGSQETEILGSRQHFITISFDRTGLELNLPPDRLGDCARETLDADEALAVLKHLASCDTVLAHQYKVRHKNNLERLSSGDPYEFCDLIAGLSQLRKDRGCLTRTDQEHLRSATRILSDELAVALGCQDRKMIESELLAAGAH